MPRKLSTILNDQSNLSNIAFYRRGFSSNERPDIGGYYRNAII
jgi:hypothetical protein